MQSNNKAASAVNPLADPRQWVARYADYLYAYAMMRINDEEQARDLVQETFLAALESVHTFQGKSLESTWLTALLKNKVVDMYRKKSAEMVRRRDMPEAVDGEFFDPLNGHWNAAHQPGIAGFEDGRLTGKEFTQILQTCMQKLPALWLSVFTMKHMDGETAAVICSELNISPSNFWVIIHRAKLNVRACLQKNWI